MYDTVCTWFHVGLACRVFTSDTVAYRSETLGRRIVSETNWYLRLDSCDDGPDGRILALLISMTVER